MSSKSTMLILQTLPDELRLVEAERCDDAVRLAGPASFFAAARGGDSSALSDQTALDNLAAYVSERGWRGRTTLVLLGGANVACQYFDMPPLEKSALRQAAQLKIAQQIHFDINEAVVAVDRMGGGAMAAGRRGAGGLSSASTEATEAAGRQMRICVTAAHRDLTAAAMTAAARAGLVVGGISAGPAVLAGFAGRCLKGGEGLCAALSLDERVSVLAVLDGPVPCVATELPFGASDLTSALMRPIIAGEDVLQLDEARALAVRNEVGIPSAEQSVASLGVTGDKLLPLLEPALQKLVKQLTQWLTYAATTAGGRRVTALRLVGPGSSLPGLAAAINSRLSIPVTAENWVEQRASYVDDDSRGDLESFSMAAAAALACDGLPNLLPPDVSRARQMARVQKSITRCGVAVAAAMLLLSVLFGRLGQAVENDVNRRRAELEQMAQVLDVNQRWSAQTDRMKSVVSQLNDFARANPAWAGVFKELSLLLPPELKATQYEGRTAGGQLTLTVSANVHSGRGGRSFDEIVSQSLLLLQRSAYFTRVELVSANRGAQPGDDQAEGALNIELALNYPRPRTGA